MSRACAALSDFNFSSDVSSSSEEDEKVKHKQGDFIGLCLMDKSSRIISDSNVSDDLSLESLCLRVVELKNALCNQDKLLYKVFRENKKLNLELESSFSEIASLRSMHDDMSAKQCDKCTMIMVNYTDLWLLHSHVASLLDSATLQLRELKAHSTLLGACTSSPVLRSDLETSAVEIKFLKHKLDHSSQYTILFPPCVVCDSLKGKLFHIACLLDSERLQLRELKAHSTLLGACTSCLVFRSDLEASAIEIKYLKYKLDHSSRYTILFPPCVVCGSLKGKLFYATKENIKLKQEVTYLTARLERTVVSEKMIEDDLSRVEESATKSTYKLGIGFKRCEDKGEKRAPKLVHTSNYHKEEETNKSTKPHYPYSPKLSFKPKRDVKKETLKLRDEACACVCGRVGHLDEFCVRCKRIEKRHFDYARNSYRDEFLNFPPRSYSRASPHTSSHALSQFSHGLNHRSYGFGS
jgi:regulator of replication initiation timing